MPCARAHTEVKKKERFFLTSLKLRKYYNANVNIWRNVLFCKIYEVFKMILYLYEDLFQIMQFYSTKWPA